ncbi:polyisoprenoid-binding protein YceI [Novosphingobium sp. PhB55]|uniref:YceI family protein n=1 Tax=Novosphingobium sp. PhB55 TaxID=2485106 RepID=UPI0010656BF0|nr:YceI family protein [Novosphingobium sp. PhB55]TDW67365.1 polyisoprenoid-binding protein YceI [Novosphingobium sp. PhB55]
MRRTLALTAAFGLAAVATALATAPILAQGGGSRTQSAQAPAMEAPGKRDASLVRAGTYQADPDHTLVEWQVGHLGFSPYFGLFGDITGTLQIDPKAPEKASVSVTIPVAKVTTASAGLTAHLLAKPKEAGGKADFFGPTPADATFVSTAVKRKGADEADVMGNLTLNGITRPVTLAARFYGAGSMPPQMGGGDNVGFEATTKIKRSDFGLGFGVPMVSDEVQLKIAAAFTHK